MWADEEVTKTVLSCLVMFFYITISRTCHPLTDPDCVSGDACGWNEWALHNLLKQIEPRWHWEWLDGTSSVFCWLAMVTAVSQIVKWQIVELMRGDIMGSLMSGATSRMNKQGMWIFTEMKTHVFCPSLFVCINLLQLSIVFFSVLL